MVLEIQNPAVPVWICQIWYPVPCPDSVPCNSCTLIMVLRFDTLPIWFWSAGLDTLHDPSHPILAWPTPPLHDSLHPTPPTSLLHDRMPKLWQIKLFSEIFCTSPHPTLWIELIHPTLPCGFHDSPTQQYHPYIHVQIWYPACDFDVVNDIPCSTYNLYFQYFGVRD